MNYGKLKSEITSQSWMSKLDFSAAEESSLRDSHVPWGVPIITDRFNPNVTTNITLLYHPDHITGNNE